MSTTPCQRCGLPQKLIGPRCECGESDGPKAVAVGAGFGEFAGTFDSMHRARFEKIDRELMREIGELKEAIAEFDAYRHAWAEMSANNTKPGRGSELAKRMEVMQGYALMTLDACAWRLRLKIRGETSSPNNKACNEPKNGE